MKIKICGLFRENDIEYANALMPDFIGFVFADKSRRHVSIEKAKTLKKLLDRRISAVGVFVDAPIDYAASCVKENIIDAVQLHGSEDEKYILSIKKAAGCQVIKAFIVNGKADTLSRAKRSPADYILFDSGAGSGKTFDWKMLKAVKRPYFLAGGLSLQNAEAAIELRPYGIDVSSGVETDGVKDFDKMRLFTELARNACKKNTDSTEQ